MKKREGPPDIGQLPRLGPAELQAIHREMFGAEHPIANCQHLRRKIAWHIQAAREGGLPEAVRAFAISIARETELRTRISQNAQRRRDAIPSGLSMTTTVVSPSHDARLPMPGSLITKKYRERTLVVKVLDDGFEYEGRHYTSLSTIAGEITGTRWNGFAFFQLGKEARNGC
ncbi:MAG TPA: DUF2924 domain-containing protein [Bryobacteraceae bacterium]|nr:DUF2924 domain-containing protein [Bryobacteraceae bacterium]